MTKAWLQDVDWELIVEINRELCAAKSALHKGTLDGFDKRKISGREITRKLRDFWMLLN